MTSQTTLTQEVVPQPAESESQPLMPLQGLQRMCDPCGGMTHHQSSLGSQLKRPTHQAHMGLWD